MVHMQGGFVLHLCTKFEADSLIHSKVMRRSQNLKIGSVGNDSRFQIVGAECCYRPRPHRDRFMVPMQVGSVLYFCTKFEANSSIHSKVIRGPKISKLGHVTSAMPTWGNFVVLHLCTEFEADSLIHSEVMRGPKIWKLGHVTLATPTYGHFMVHMQEGVSPLCLYQI